MSTQLIESLKLAAGSFCNLFITGENSPRDSRRRRRRSEPRVKRLRFEQLEPLTMLSGTTSDIHIDSTWLSQQGTGPYLLMQNDTRYILDTDITTAGTAVVIGGQNINLDLNGHTITYGAGPSPTVLNGGFETGSGSAVTGWDLTLAPKAVLAPNTHYLFGSQVLRLENFSQTQTLLSAPIAIPEANHTYTASVIPGGGGDSRTTLVLSVLDAVTGQVLGTSSSGNNVERGTIIPVTFFATTTSSVRLKIEVTPASGITTSVELDRAAVMRSFDYGVLTTQQWSGDIPGFANLSAAAKAAYGTAANVTIQGGQILQGQSQGYGDTAIFAEYVGGDFTVDSIRTQIAGVDARSVNARNARGKVTIRSSQFDLGLETVTDRMSNFAAITVSATGGDVLIENNHIAGTGQIGISVGSVPDHQVTIRGNDIRNIAVATNSYAISVVALNGFEISNNTVVTDNGRGIMVDGYSALPIANGEIFGNYVEVQEGFNREYLSGQEARALRMRNNVDAEGAQRNIHVHDNTLIAKTGSGLAESAYGLRVSYVNNNGAMNDAGIVFDHNIVKAITFDPNRRAKAFVLDGASAGINLLVSHNSFESNDVSLQVGDADGGNGNYDTQFLSNTLRKSSEGAAVNYSAVGYGYWVRENHRITILDTQYENGAANTVSWVGQGLKDASFGWLLSVHATSASGAALNGAAVRIFDDTNTLVFVGTANAQGELFGIPIITKVVSQNGNDPTVLITTQHTMYQVEVSATGYTTSFSPVTMNQSLDLTIALIANVTAVNDAPAGTNKTVATLEGTAYTFAVADFGFSDPSDSPANTLLAVKIASLPTAGALTNNGLAVSAGQFISAVDIAAGKLKFAPAANASGTNYANFNFQVQDNGGTANGGTDLDPAADFIMVNVTAVNDAPAGTNKTVATLEGTAYTFAVADFGFSDPSDSPANTLLAVKIASLPTAGVLTNIGLAVSAGQFISAVDIAAGKLKFAPAANASGTNYANFNFQVQDNGGTANGGTDLDPAADFIMVNVTPADTIAPTVAAFSPANGAASVPTTSAATITFSEALNASTVNVGSVFLRDASNTVVATTLSYDPVTKRVTLTPTSPLSNSTAYTIVVKGGSGGVKDMAGNALVADALSSFTTAAPITAASLWTPSVMPATVDSGDGKAVELGVKFTSDVNGFITGLRFYKSAANTGTHLGSLWTANGQRLATATFTNETAIGWQQVNFSSPVAITAGTTYLASYHTNVGHYSKTQSYFNSQFNSGPLHVPSNGGVYLYGAGGFPTKAFQGANYWVDVVLSDTIAPTVAAFSPANGAASVPTTSAATITFSEALNASTVNVGSVFLRDASNTVVATTLSYDPVTKRVTLTPTSPLSNSTAYTIVVKGGSGGVKDMAGNALVADALSSFTTAAPITAASLWTPSVMPATVDSGDGKAVELGVKFTSDVNGFITGLRFYKSAANTGTHLGSLWTANGQRLATATFTNETAIGWQQVNFSSPVAITAGTTYLASYHTNVGHYSKTQSYFNSQFNSGPLHVPSNGGVYLYGAGGFPTKANQGSNYWVDVVLSTIPPADTIAPTVAAFSPANGAASVPTTSAATITFSEALNASTVNVGSVFLRDASNTVVATTLSYDPVTKRVTLTPTSPLSNSTAYTIVVKGGSGGVKDMAGNALAADALSSFTTAAATSAPVSLWDNSATPAVIDVNDGQSIELGTKFTADVNGTINGARFFKSAANTGTHTASLWTAAGQLLATATFVNETASGWQQVNFSTPVAIIAGMTYVISYHTNVGHYSKTESYFSSQFNSGYLRVPANGGVYRYGTSGLPNQTYLASNYWVDALFVPFGS